ncbi:hypothetical protein Sjap_025424 [Stephania japonica]|uniref:F-box domain-containing protein n=1 Tax=Stephania japonica TaxID=461633 RepID=A0AAP0E9F8_9MAGN
MAAKNVLPDELIEHIFSFMNIPKDLIQTSRLARRWRYFWRSAPATALNFDDPSLKFFLRFFQHASPSTAIHRLSIQCCSDKADLFYDSLSTAISHHVRDLHISPPSSCPVPISLFSTCNLKTLKLHYDVEGVSEISCSDLEFLVLKDSEFGKANSVFALRTPKLRKLEMDYYHEPDTMLELHTPKLSSFSFTNRSLNNSLIVCTFGNLNIDIDDAVSKKMHHWFKYVCSISNRLQRLRAHRLSIEKASHAWVSATGEYRGLKEITIALGKLFRFYGNLRSLELNASFENSKNIASFASLMISNCSSIEVLILRLTHCPKSPYAKRKKVLNLPPLSCKLNKLKYIVVLVEGMDSDLELVRFLLCSAVNLQTMVIAWNHFVHKIGVFEQFRDTISQEYPRVHFLFQSS